MLVRCAGLGASMLEVALRSLIHDRGKLIGSLAGVAFASTLLLVQIGLFVGLVSTASAVIRRAGGDVWVMGRGTEVLDNGETLAEGSRALLAEQPCVARVRGVIFAVAPVRKPSGALDYVQIVGVEGPAPRAASAIPWQLERGLLRDLELPLRVAIDEHDLGKLQIESDPLGAALEVSGQLAYVAGLTRGIRSFALYPYLFTHIDNARRLSGTAAEQAQYWVADLTDAACAPAVIAGLGRATDLDARTTLEFAALTERYWVFGSGAGAALAFSALFSLVIGVVIVGQTLYAITREHLKELATLKAMGASRRELIGFVAWQASFIGAVGGALGLLMALGLQDALSSEGIAIVLSPAVLGVSAAAVLSMCALASLPSARKVLAVEAAEVFR
jgi:putative ABC transport system permease protein